MVAMTRFVFLALLGGALLWEPLDPDALPYELYQPLSGLPVFSRSRYWSKDLSHLGIDQWPNKEGPLKRSFEFRIGDYPELRGYETKSDHRSTWPGSISRCLWLEKGPSSLTIEIETHGSSNAEAQRRLLCRVTSTSFPIVPILRTGFRLGPSLGDVCLHTYDPISYPPTEWRIFDFVRNNIRVQVYASSDNDVNAYRLAHAIDDRIRSSE